MGGLWHCYTHNTYHVNEIWQSTRNPHVVRWLVPSERNLHLPSGFIKHGSGKSMKIPYKWGFIARKITYFYGPWLPASHVWLPQRSAKWRLPPMGPLNHSCDILGCSIINHPCIGWGSHLGNKKNTWCVCELPDLQFPTMEKSWTTNKHGGKQPYRPSLGRYCRTSNSSKNPFWKTHPFHRSQFRTSPSHHHFCSQYKMTIPSLIAGLCNCLYPHRPMKAGKTFPPNHILTSCFRIVYPKIFPPSSYGFPQISYGFLSVSHRFPMVFPKFPKVSRAWPRLCATFLAEEALFAAPLSFAAVLVAMPSSWPGKRHGERYPEDVDR